MFTCTVCNEPITYSRKLRQWMHASIARLNAPVHRIIASSEAR